MSDTRRRGEWKRAVIRALALVLVAAGTRPALAEPPAPRSMSPANAQASRGRASEQFRTGVRRYQDGDLQGAAAAFALAYELSNDYRLLYNLAQVQEDLQDHAQALRSLALYLERGGAQIDAERREQVEGTRAELERRSASVRVKAHVAGARLWIDGVPAGSSGTEPTWLNPGVHRLLVAEEGRSPVLQTLVLRPGERRLIDVPPRGPEPSRAGDARGEPALPPEHTLALVGMGAAGASAALAVGFALLTRTADARLDRELARHPANAEALDAARSRVATLAAVTDVCIGTSALAAGLSLYFALQAPKPDAAPLGNLQLEVAPGGSSLVFERAF